MAWYLGIHSTIRSANLGLKDPMIYEIASSKNCQEKKSILLQGPVCWQQGDLKVGSCGSETGHALLLQLLLAHFLKPSY